MEQRSLLLVVRIHQRSKQTAEMSKEPKEMYSQGQPVSRQVSERRKSERAKALILLNNLADLSWAKTQSQMCFQQHMDEKFLLDRSVTEKLDHYTFVACWSSFL